jgi:4,5-DOPA dioxygenase extradiol
VVHNLARIDWGHPDAAFDWARAFDEAARATMTSDPQAVLGLRDHDAYGLAAPSPDHFLPLVYLAGLAAASAERPATLVDGYAMGSISMTSYTVGLGDDS